jgi:hypothetical protein
MLLDAQAGRHREHADVVGHADDFGAMKSDRHWFGRCTPSTTGLTPCWRRPYQVKATSLRDVVGVDLDVVVVHVFAGSRAMAPLAVSQRPSMIFFSIAWPSSNTLLAASPTTSSVRMAG